MINTNRNSGALILLKDGGELALTPGHKQGSDARRNLAGHLQIGKPSALADTNAKHHRPALELDLLDPDIPTPRGFHFVYFRYARTAWQSIYSFNSTEALTHDRLRFADNSFIQKRLSAIK